MSAVFGPATNGQVKLSDFYNDEIRPRLTPDLVYDWPGHNWHRSHGKWRGACPHHTSESGTSFNVSLDTLTWFCPACDVGGGPVQYLHWLQGGTGSPRGREFVDVLRDLATRVGLALPERELTDDERAAAEAAATKRGALELVYRVCRDHLWSDAGESARAYLHGRGIGDDGNQMLDLGLYPPLREIKAALTAAGYQPDIDTGAWWKLVGYVTFPWRDDYGQPLTLYGRWPGSSGWPTGCEKTMALPGEGSKGSPLYFDRLRRAHHTDAVLVEGLLDAAVAQANDLTNVIAYVGAQPSYAQHAVLARHRIKTATICSDPDKGGEGGILSFLRNADPSIRTYVAPKLTDGQDPDEFMLAHGVDGWQRHIASAEAGHVWQARHILSRYDLTTPKGRDSARVELVEYSGGAQEHEQDDISAVAAEPLRMDQGTLRRYLSEGDGQRNGNAEQSAPTPIRALPSAPEEAEEPAVPFPLDALVPQMRRLVVEGAAALPCPADFIAIPLLTAAGVAIGDAMELELKSGWREGANLYTAVVGDPGSKKTPSGNLALAPLFRIQKRLHSEYRTAKAEYDDEMARWEKTPKKERNAPPEKPGFVHLVTTDATVEAIAPMLASGKGILLSREELSGWVSAMNQYRSGGKGSDRQSYLSMWSRTLLKIDRKSSPEPVIVLRPFLAVTGGIQTDLLPGLADPESREDGFVDRILWGYPDTVLDAWTTVGVAYTTIAAAERVFERLYALQGEPDPDVEDENATRPRVVRLSASAMVLWSDWYRDQAAELADEDFPTRLRGPWAKMPGQAARLALILHCTERGGAGEDPAAFDVSDWALGGALDLVDSYFKPHARRVYRLLARQSRDQVVRLLEALKQSGPMLKRDILLSVFQGHVPAARVDAMLEELEIAGLAFRQEKRSESGKGRSGTWWGAA